MSTGTKIVKSGSEPPTAVELDVAQVGKKKDLVYL
jgi:hypothetical protein